MPPPDPPLPPRDEAGAFLIARADFDDARLIDLIRLHLAGMHASSPPGSVFALDYSALQAPDVSLYVVESGADIAGMGGLKALDAKSGEIKSMRTDPRYSRRGVGQFLLDHIIGEARRRGYRRLSLETGSGPAFEAAARLYERNGFVSGGVFGAYAQSAFNRFFHLEI